MADLTKDLRFPLVLPELPNPCRPVETSAPRCIWRSGCKHPVICKREGQCVLTVEDALAAGRRHVDYILKEEQKRSGK